jgi:hydroxyacylglutathione hydrolase
VGKKAFMGNLQIHQFPCRSDNYGVLIHDPDTEATASIDAPDAEEVLEALRQRGWVLTHILTTHHHADHTSGNLRLKELTGCNIIGPAKEARSIPGIDVEVAEGDRVEVGNFTAEVLGTPGHTAGHISYVFPKAELAFVGDTLFSLGCGRLFEGDAETMWGSLSKLAALPENTTVYCGHEYTLNNAKFALTIEPENDALKLRAAEVQTLGAEGKPSLPTTIGQELATNPFLRPSSPDIQKRLEMEGRPLHEVFGEIRKRKDRA